MPRSLRSLFVTTCLIALAAGCNCKGTTGNESDGGDQTDAGCVGAGCTTPGNDGGGSDAGDAGPPPVCDQSSCAAPNVCEFGACIPPPTACSTDFDCTNDRYCVTDGGVDAGQCIPYGIGPRDAGYNPQCSRIVAAGLFAPVVACAWTDAGAGDPYPNHANVLSTPLVVDFHFTRTIEDGVHPSIVFNTYNCDDGAAGQNAGCYGVIRVVDGHTCQLQFNVGGDGGDTTIIGSVTPAIADLDGDGRPDIVVQSRDGGILGFGYHEDAGTFVPLWTRSTGFDALNGHWDSLAIHDLDDDGVPEIIEASPHPAVYNNRGQLLDGGSPGINTTYNSTQLHPVVGRLDDGGVVMVTGAQLLTFNTAKKIFELAANTGQPLGLTAMADFGTYSEDGGVSDRTRLDGVPEVVAVSNGTVRIQTLGGRVLFTHAVFDGGTGGAPTVADFDGDGRAEFGVAGADAYSVYDPDCIAGSDAGLCPSGATNGILWAQPSQDHSSQVTGSSVFDFNGDGTAEVVYADECFSRVYDGPTGRVEYSQFHTSCTWYENPVVADTAGDFHSKIVIPSNSSCNVSCPSVDPIDRGLACDTDADCPTATACVRDNAADRFGLCRCSQTSDCAAPGLVCTNPVSNPAAGNVCRAQHPQGSPQRGILVMEDRQGRWVPSRDVWNQHAYSVTNVDDTGAVPRTSQWKQNWKQPGLNNYRTNVQGTASVTNVPDLTAAPAGTYSCNGSTATLQTRVCNRGTAPVGQGMPVTFYAGPVANQQPICTVATRTSLSPGDCTVLSCDWATTTTATDVNIVANDDGTGTPTTAECSQSNNLGIIPGVVCVVIQ